MLHLPPSTPLTWHWHWTRSAPARRSPEQWPRHPPEQRPPQWAAAPRRAASPLEPRACYSGKEPPAAPGPPGTDCCTAPLRRSNAGTVFRSRRRCRGSRRSSLRPSRTGGTPRPGTPGSPQVYPPIRARSAPQQGRARSAPPRQGIPRSCRRPAATSWQPSWAMLQLRVRGCWRAHHRRREYSQQLPRQRCPHRHRQAHRHRCVHRRPARLRCVAEVLHPPFRDEAAAPSPAAAPRSGWAAP